MNNISIITDYLVVSLLGALVGFIEVIGRYRDAPFRVANSKPAFFYILINMLAAVIALLLVRLFGWTFTPRTEPEIVRWVQVMVAGSGAMILFRSSLFILNIGDQNFLIGPSTILQALLEVVDSEIDRQRGKIRADFVKNVMKGITWSQAKDGLPEICIDLMQNLSEDSRKAILDSVKLLKDPTLTISEQAKLLTLGLTLLNFVGEDVVSAAIGSLELRPKRTRRLPSLGRKTNEDVPNERPLEDSSLQKLLTGDSTPPIQG